MEERLIAPCGMNCAICVNYLAMKHELKKRGFQRSYCLGCLPRGQNCLHMGDRCETLGKGLVRFCFECGEFPCKRLKALDMRYRTKYHMSMIENLRAIEERGAQDFLQSEEIRCRCPDCGDTICCHNGLCLRCGIDTLRRTPKYRWGEEEKAQSRD